MRLILLVLLFLILSFHQTGKLQLNSSFQEQASIASPVHKSQVDRRALFLSIYQRYLLIAIQATQDLYDHLTDIEKTYIKQILIVADYYIYKTRVPLVFSRDSSIFKLPDGSPPRTFLIGFNLGEPIYVNLNIINDPLTETSVSKVFQLLTHDFGHFVKDKNQSIVDGLTAKLQSIIESQQMITTTSDGAKIEIFAPNKIASIKNANNSQANHLTYLQFNPLFFFIEKNGKIIDATEGLVLALESRQRIDLSDNGKQKYFRNFFWNIDSLTPVEENDPKRSWFKIRTTQIDFAGSLNIETLDSEFFNNTNQAPEKMMQLHEFVVGINDSSGKVERLYDVERFSATQNITNGSIKVIEDKNGLVRLQVHIDESLYEVNTEKDIVLLINSNQKLIHLSLKKIAPNLFEAEVKKPEGSVNLEISSLLLKGTVQLYFNEGINIAGKGLDGTSQKPFGIKKVGFRIEDQFYSLKKEQTLPREKVFMEFLVQSDSPILEIRLMESKNYGILNSVANKDFMLAPLYKGDERYSHPAIRTDYDLKIFTSHQFSQSKVSENLYKVMIPYDFELHPLLDPSHSLQRDIQKEILKNPLHALKQMDQLMSSYLEQSVQGNDLGVRKLHHIQLTNANLNHIRIVPKNPFNIDLMGDFKPKPSRSISHQCHKLFQ